MAGTAMKIFIFSYGTLKFGEPNHHLFNEAELRGCRFVGKAVTEAVFPLIIATPNNIPFLLFRDGLGKNILGEVYETDPKGLEYLDKFEGYPDFYQRRLIPITVTSDAQGKEVEPYTLNCFIYGLEKFKPALLQEEQFSSYHSAGPHNKPLIPLSNGETLFRLNKFLFEETHAKVISS